MGCGGGDGMSRLGQMSSDCVKRYRKCYCVSCCEDMYERANDRAMAMNVWDAEGHDYYDSFPEDEYGVGD